MAGSGNPSQLGEVAGPCGFQGTSRGRFAASVCEDLGGFRMVSGSATLGPGTPERATPERATPPSPRPQQGVQAGQGPCRRVGCTSGLSCFWFSRPDA